MPSKSKIKGSTFERDVAKTLNQLYNTDEFSRTFGSGAFVGKSNWNKRKGLSNDVKTALAGDIITPSWFPFSIECKHYDDTPVYHNILTQDGDTTLNLWLGKSMFDGINTNLIPCVFFKTTRKGVYVALPDQFEHILRKKFNYAIYGCFIIFSLDILKLVANDVLDAINQTSILNDTIEFFKNEKAKNDSFVFKLVEKFENS